MQTRSEVVADHLRDRILCGHLPANTHLQEIPLSEEMGVSRTPVRSALQALAAEGLLEYVAKRGYTVRRFSMAEIETAHEVRADLEGIACRLASERGLSAEQCERFEAILDSGDGILCEGRLREQDREAWIEMNDAFHGLVLDIADNRLLNDLIAQTYKVPLASSRVVHWYGYQLVRGSHQFHHRIYRYIRDRRSVNAEALMREHILQAVDQIRGRTRPVADPPVAPATVAAV